MPADGQLVVRRIVPGDWAALRGLRLETLEAARALSPKNWQSRAVRGSEQGTSIQLLACAGDQAVATALTYVADGVAWFGAVYVTPRWRGRGLLTLLVAPCADWARGQGMSALLLEVHEDNAYARASYERLGFADTGRRQPYPLDPSGDELVMELAFGS